MSSTRGELTSRISTPVDDRGVESTDVVVVAGILGDISALRTGVPIGIGCVVLEEAGVVYEAPITFPDGSLLAGGAVLFGFGIVRPARPGLVV